MEYDKVDSNTSLKTFIINERLTIYKITQIITTHGKHNYMGEWIIYVRFDVEKGLIIIVILNCRMTMMREDRRKVIGWVGIKNCDSEKFIWINFIKVFCSMWAIYFLFSSVFLLFYFTSCVFFSSLKNWINWQNLTL